MKKSLIRIALSFATYTDDELNSFAILVGVCLQNNPLFLNPTIAVDVLNALQMTFQNAIIAAAQGGAAATAAKNEARTALLLALRQNAAYVQSLALEKESDVLSSGYDVINMHTSPSPLGTPVLNGLDNSVSAQLRLRMTALANAKAYQVQFCVGAGPWQEGGIVLQNLAPGTVYSVRVRGIGGSTRYSEWSATVSLMAI